MKTIKIYLLAMLMVSSAAYAQRTGFIDDVYFKPSDARNIDIKANERQKPVVKNGARQIVFVDAANTDVIITKDTVFVLEKAKEQTAQSEDSITDEGYYIGGFKGSNSDLEYAERIRRFHNPRYSIHISDPGWNDIYFLNSWDWNVYVDGSYAWVTPTWTNNLWFDYHYRPYSYSSWYWRSSWGWPHYGGWGGYGGYGWNSWSHGYYSGYYAGYYGWPYGYGGGYGGYYGYGSYWNNPYYWNNWGGSNYVSNNNRGRATDYNYSGTRQSTVNSGGGAGAPAFSSASGTRSSYSAIGGSAQSGTRTVSTGTRSISTGDRSQSVAPGFTRSYSTDRSVDGRSYSTQGSRTSSASNNSSTRSSNFDTRTSSGTAASSASGSRSTTTTGGYTTAPASSRSYSTAPSSTRSSSTYSAPSSTRSTTTTTPSSSSNTYRSSSSSSSSSSVSNTRSSSSSYSSGSSGSSYSGSSSSGSRSSSTGSSSSSGTRR